MAGSKAALILCMDVGFSMSNSAPGEESPFDSAKKVVQKFVQRQVFAEKKDEMGLVLFGTDSTKNPLDKGGQYQNITVHREMTNPDFELLEEIANQIQPENQQADWLDALVVCLDLLQTHTQGKKFDRRNIAILTDLSTEADAEQLDIIVENLKKMGVILQFFLPFPVEEADGSGDGTGSGSDHPGAPGKGLSREQRSGLDMVKQVMLSLDEDGLDEVYTFRDAVEQLCMFKRIERRPTAWPCQLTIGSSLAIRIVGYKAVMEEKLKKSWMTVDAQSNSKEDLKKETVYCLDDDNETEVDKEQIIQGFCYGSDIVPFSKVDQDQMKYKHDGKCFAVLGFTKRESVPHHLFSGNQAMKMFAPEDDEHAAAALSALVRALHQLNKVAIVRYAHNRVSNPQVGAAIPCVKQNSECLIYVQLPFMEDLKLFNFPSFENKKFKPSDEQLAAVDSLIDSMMLVEDDEDGGQRDIFKNHHIPNPEFQRHFQCLHHRALNPGTALPPPDPWLRSAMDQPDVIRQRCRAPVEELKRKFPLTEVEKKKKAKTSDQVFKDSEQTDVEKTKDEDEDEEFRLANISEGSVTSVGSVNPDRDFRSLLSRKTLPMDEVCQQLTRRIEQFLGNKNTEYYMKSITCIQAFREQSVKLENAELYNSYLQSLKRIIPNRGLEVFWGLLVQDGVTLISEQEVASSGVSKQEADQFLMDEEKKEEAMAATAGDSGDFDDLLDMM